LSRAARAGLLATCALLTAALAAIPEPARSPLGRVASVDGDGPDPLYDAPLDTAALRRAAEIVPGGARYAIVADEGSPVLQGNLKAAAQLFLAPALPVQDVGEADWVLIYGEISSDTLGERRIGRDLALVRASR
jgi:hypothetical protein